MTQAAIVAVEYYLPEGTLSNSDIAAEFPDWNVDKIEEKTGIANRHIAGPHQYSSDLAVESARKLFQSGACSPESIDFVLLCTQSPDFFLPTTACLIQERLGIAQTAGALDFNLGCSGYIYGLGLAKGLVETGQAHNVLLVTAETYSKFLRHDDKTVRTLFGDAAAATLIQGIDSDKCGSEPCLGPFIYGTDGGGGRNLIVPGGGLRTVAEPQKPSAAGSSSQRSLYMDGPAIFNFTLKSVPSAVDALLFRSGKQLKDIDLFVFHQANRYMLEHLRKKIGIPTDKFYVSLRDCGNTVSSTIPIALHRAILDGSLRAGQLIMLVGFGVGYSWGATLVRWTDAGARS